MNSVSVTAATMVLRRKFSAKHYFEDVRRYNVTVMQYIGELCRYLLTVPEVKKYGRFQTLNSWHFLPFSRGQISAPFPIENSHPNLFFPIKKSKKKKIFFCFFYSFF